MLQDEIIWKILHMQLSKVIPTKVKKKNTRHKKTDMPSQDIPR